jgi:hypothetical protein
VASRLDPAARRLFNQVCRIALSPQGEGRAFAIGLGVDADHHKVSYGLGAAKPDHIHGSPQVQAEGSLWSAGPGALFLWRTVTYVARIGQMVRARHTTHSARRETDSAHDGRRLKGDQRQ